MHVGLGFNKWKQMITAMYPLETADPICELLWLGHAHPNRMRFTEHGVEAWEKMGQAARRKFPAEAEAQSWMCPTPSHYTAREEDDAWFFFCRAFVRYTLCT